MRRCVLIVACTSAACLSSTPPVVETAGEASSGGTDATDSGGSQGTVASASTGESTTDDSGQPSTCDQTPLRVATFNIQSVGTGDQFTGLAATLYRIDADVVCLQEVEDVDVARVPDLAAQAGYDYIWVAEKSPAIGGELRNACLGQSPLTLVGSFTAGELSPDQNANDVGRDILVVRVEPIPGCSAGVFTVHLKAGSDDQDVFRRAMEVERLVQAVELYRTERPDDAVVVAGDFNEQVTDSVLGRTFDAPVPGLPGTYNIGADISFPVRYHPFERLIEQGFAIADATWEDSSTTATWNGVSRLDYVMYGQAVLVGDEVYNSCEDNGIDDDPPGNWIPKRGEPLACFSSQVASDHLPVVVDLVLP